MTGSRYTGRTQRVRDYLATHPKGATARELIVAVEPGRHPNNMAATIAGLVNTRKLRAVRTEGRTRYYATDTIHVDGRTAANAVGKNRRKPPTAAPARPAGPAASAPIRREMRRDAAVAMQKRPAVDATADAETVEQFEARGGRIQKLGNGEGWSQPLKHIGHQAINAATSRERERRAAKA